MDDLTEIGYLDGIEISHDAESEKVVRLIGDRGTADVTITDASMTEFVEAGEEVFKAIHRDMNEFRETFDWWDGDDQA